MTRQRRSENGERSSGRPPKRSLGQNFLIDGNYVRSIIRALQIKEDDLFLEIGPGKGALTRDLVRLAGCVVAIELDRNLASALRREFSGADNFHLMEEDALEADLAKALAPFAKAGGARLVANLPYNISTPILRRLNRLRHLFEDMTVMLQKEVAERVSALPGNRLRGFLTVVIKRNFNIGKLFDVPPTAFRPVPAVESSVVRLKRRERTVISDDEELLFERLVSTGFRQKRKTIRNNLLAADRELSDRFEVAGGISKMLSEAGIGESERAEALEMAQWEALARLISR